MDRLGKILITAGGLLFLTAVEPASAARRPEAGCKSDPRTLEINKKAVAEFFRPGITTEERIALMDPAYIQHNPAYLKRAHDDKISTIEAFRRLQEEGRARTAAAPPAAGPKPPAPEIEYIVMAECEFVTIIRKTYRQDPTAPPGTWYEAFPYDTYTLKNGKLYEHWDDFSIAPAGTPPSR